MVTAVDTNVLSALLSGTSEDSTRAQEALKAAADLGSLYISPVVYAELRAAPRGTEAEVQKVLASLRIEVDWRLHEDVWRVAATAFRGYAQRRRKEGEKDAPKRFLADFLIGAHALTVGGRLLTFDQGKYRAAFAKLQILP